jgi:hypothetical protein
MKSCSRGPTAAAMSASVVCGGGAGRADILEERSLSGFSL